MSLKYSVKFRGGDDIIRTLSTEYLTLAQAEKAAKYCIARNLCHRAWVEITGRNEYLMGWRYDPETQQPIVIGEE